MEAVDRVGPTVVHAPSMFDDETTEVDAIGFADELLSCDGIFGLQHDVSFFC